MDLTTLLVIAQPTPQVQRGLNDAFAECGLSQKLGKKPFPVHKWHQSLSRKWVCSPFERDRIVEGVSLIDASAFTIVFSRVSGDGEDFQSIHWAFRPTGRPQGFDAALAAIRRALHKENMGGNTPHITVSYRAPCPLKATEIRPVPWRIDELLLVEIRDDWQRYHPLARWPLRLERQLELF